MMEAHLGESFQGTVTGITENGLWVELGGWNVDGMLPIDSLPADRYRLDRERNALRGQKHRREIAFGARLTVQLARADRQAQTLELAFLQWGWAEAHEGPRPPPAAKRKRQRKR